MRFSALACADVLQSLVCGPWLSLEKCEMMGFDYNRDIHYIQKRNNVDDNTIRIVLKIHYVVVPKYMSFLSSLCKVCNERYNEVARDNFNKSKTPDSLTEKNCKEKATPLSGENRMLMGISIQSRTDSYPAYPFRRSSFSS